MRLLEEDQKTLESKFPGATQFILEAERRYVAFRQMSRVRDRQMRNVDPDDQAYKEDWYLEKIKAEGLSLPSKKIVKMPKEENKKPSKS